MRQGPAMRRDAASITPGAAPSRKPAPSGKPALYSDPHCSAQGKPFPSE